MRYSIKINREIRYIQYSIDGRITIKEIVEVWKQVLCMDEFTEKKYNLLSDYRKATFDFDVEEIDKIEGYLESIKTILNGKRNAVIVDSPDDIVIPMLLANKTYGKIIFHIKTFSTKEAAIRFLL